MTIKLLHRIGIHFPRDYTNCVDCLLWRMRFTRIKLSRHVPNYRRALPIEDHLRLKLAREEIKRWGEIERASADRSVMRSDAI